MYMKFSHYIKIEQRRVKTCGIAVISLKRIEIRKDVSTDSKSLKQLVRRMNKGKIEIVHLDDVLDDFYTFHF